MTELAYRRLLFTETQRLTQWWIWLIAAVVALVPAALITLAFVRHQVSLVFFLAVLAVCTIAPLTFRLMTLHVTLASDQLFLRFFPFVRRRIPTADIRAFEPITYRPLRDYGGWGVKWSLHDSTPAYTVSGDQGIRLTLARGQLLIGTQRPGDFAAALTQAGVPRAPLTIPPASPAPADSSPGTAHAAQPPPG